MDNTGKSQQIKAKVQDYPKRPCFLKHATKSIKISLAIFPALPAIVQAIGTKADVHLTATYNNLTLPTLKKISLKKQTFVK